MKSRVIRFALTLLPLAGSLWVCSATQDSSQHQSADQPKPANKEKSMLVQYLEIVTPEVDATCKTLEKQHGVSFGKPEPGYGNARIAALNSGGRIGVLAPLAEHEGPRVRPYMLGDDIETALEAAQASGAQVAMASTEIPGQGSFAIYILGGIQHGLWQR